MGQGSLAGEPMKHQQEFIDVRGTKVELLRGGSGAPLLYLHGAGGEVAWLPFFDALAKDFTVYIPAHPGFSHSGSYDKIDSIHDLVFHYIDLMEILKLDQPFVAGFSLGGWLAAEIAVHHPTRLRKMALIDAVGIKVESAPIADIFAPAPPQARELFFYDPESELAKTMVPDIPSPEMLEAFLRAREGTARVGWNPYLFDPRLRERLYRVIAPTLLIWGDSDRVVSLEHAKAYKEGIPHSKLSVLDKCGHCPPFEKPSETAALIASFFKAQ